MIPSKPTTIACLSSWPVLNSSQQSNTMRRRSAFRASWRGRFQVDRRVTRQSSRRRSIASDGNSGTTTIVEPDTPAMGGIGVPQNRAPSSDIVITAIEVHEKTEELRRKRRLVTTVNEFTMQHGRECPEATTTEVAGFQALDPNISEERIAEVAPFLRPLVPFVNNMWWQEAMQYMIESYPKETMEGENNAAYLPDIWSLIDSLHQFTTRLESLVEGM